MPRCRVYGLFYPTITLLRCKYHTSMQSKLYSVNRESGEKYAFSSRLWGKHTMRMYERRGFRWKVGGVELRVSLFIHVQNVVGWREEITLNTRRPC